MCSLMRPTDLTSYDRNLKLHYFVPSCRELWTVVGKNKEYWVDIELDYCTCKHYFFRTLSGNERCIHLKILETRSKSGDYDKVEFHDDEYNDFITLLIKDILISNFN